jgi:hypothetical protein
MFSKDDKKLLIKSVISRIWVLKEKIERLHESRKDYIQEINNEIEELRKLEVILNEGL